MATMATSGVSSTLGVPTADDTMEISSDAGRGEQDLDLDFMADDDGHNDVDWMLQDAASERGNPEVPEQQTRTDDLMYDDGDEITYVEEDTMQDDTPTHPEPRIENTDLDIDFEAHPATEETLYDAAEDVELQVDGTYQEPEQETLIDYDAFEDQGEQQFDRTQDVDPVIAAPVPEESRPDGSSQPSQHADTTLVEQSEGQQATAEPDITADGTKFVGSGEVVGNDIHSEAQDYLRPQEEQQDHEPSNHTAPQPEQAGQADISAKPNDDVTAQLLPVPGAAPALPELEREPATEPASTSQVDSQRISIHPVTIYYASSIEYSLFPMSEHDDPNTCLLQDSSVASSTLNDFFRACRSVLDQDLNDDLELELYIDSLNLTIPEDSTHCRDTSLAQIIEVYVELMHNAGIEEPTALHMELNVKNRLSAQLNSLFKAAGEKKSLYDLPFYQDQPQQAIEQSPESSESEEQQLEGETEPSEGAFIEETVLEDNTGENVSQADEKTDQDTAEHGTTDAEGSIPITTTATHDSTQQIQPDYEETKDETEVEDEYNYDQATEAEEHDTERQGEQQQFVDADAEQGYGSSSGSSTVHEETQPSTSSVYSSSSDEGEWLIDYSDEDNEYDASSETVQVSNEAVANQDFGDEEQIDARDFGGASGGLGTQETYNFAGEEQIESFDDSTLDADTFNQEFSEYNDYATDVEYHEEALAEDHDHNETHQDWAHEDAQPGEQVAAIGSGTFEIPEESEEGDEDEITFNDDEFTVDDGDTQDATTQEPSETSPLGKRSREEDEDGLLDGSDQESKRLKAA